MLRYENTYEKHSNCFFFGFNFDHNTNVDEFVVFVCDKVLKTSKKNKSLKTSTNNQPKMKKNKKIKRKEKKKLITHS